MTERVEANVEPTLLRWARDSAGYGTRAAAAKARVKVERLEAWESGELRPTVKQLRTLARIYKRPLAVFYLPEPPRDFQPIHDYRRLPGRVAGTMSPELRYEIRRAQDRRETAIDLFAGEGEEPPELLIVGSLADDPDQLAAEIRRVLGVSLDEQRRWADAYEALNSWRAAIESAGALVMQMTDVERAESRGFSISERPLPVIVANIKDAPAARVFTLLHELVHVALRRGGLCDLDDTATRPPEELEVERFSNRVAGAALVPADALATDPIVAAHGSGTSWRDDEIWALATRFSVSREVIVRRLLITGRASDAFYRQKRQRYEEEYEELRGKRAPGFAPPDRIAFASAGPTLVGLVLGGHAQGRLTASDVSDILGIRLKHLPRVRRALLDRTVAAA